MNSPLDALLDTPSLDLPGLEADNLLSFLALVGLLRALETTQPGWRPRVSWHGPPWVARLHLADAADEATVAKAAAEGIDALVTRFDTDGRRNVDFDRQGYRDYAQRVRGNPTSAALCAALAAEWPETKSGRAQVSPFVMMFGQGHQNFLERLIAVPRGDLPNRLRKLKSPPDMSDPAKIAEALFAPWRRKDDADAFRWDPEEDQRYALRFDDPSAAGAALTVHGANRLAAIGFLSFITAATEHRIEALGAVRDDAGWSFVWPVWSVPLSRSVIEALLAHPGISSFAIDELRPLGVMELYRARRVANGKYMNVARAQPVSSGSERVERDAASSQP